MNKADILIKKVPTQQPGLHLCKKRNAKAA